MTIDEGKKYLKDNWIKGVDCPCCNQFVKLYPRPIHTTMALMLIRLYQFDKNSSDDYFHVKELVKGISFTGTSDFSKLRYWGIVIEKPLSSNEKNKRTSGYWGITEKGRNFVEGKITVPAKVLLYNKEFKAYGKGNTTIKQALGNKFDYNELMGFNDSNQPKAVSWLND